MTQLDKWIDNKVLQNVVAWLLAFVVTMLSIVAENKWLMSLQIILFLLAPVYISNLKILPVFLNNKFKGFLLFNLNAIVFAIIALLLIYAQADSIDWMRVLSLYGILAFLLLFAAAIKLVRDSFERRQQMQAAELKLLKSQLNPHFLFNTLNNLYGLSVIKSDKLPDLMLQLSDLLRYSLYDTKATFVPLKKEIAYLENYISLEKIRLEEQVAIRTNIENVDSELSIAPMLLIAFLENAFKHLSKEEDAFVDVVIQLDGQDLLFSCANSKAEATHNLEKGNGGIGLQNVQKRLDFLYPNKYDLTMNNDTKIFKVDLKINLAQ